MDLIDTLDTLRDTQAKAEGLSRLLEGLGKLEEIDQTLKEALEITVTQAEEIAGALKNLRLEIIQSKND